MKSSNIKKLRNIEKRADILSYLEENGKRHKNYKLYFSKKNVIDNLLKYNALFFSNGNSWNDVEDRERLNSKNNDDYKFALCTSAMATENVALWMLYSKNDGYMLDITNKIVTEIMNCEEIEIVSLDETKCEIIKTLYKDKFNIKVMDVLYYEKEASKYCFDVKHSDGRNKKFNIGLLDEGKDYFIKSMPWSYEKECRIIISVKKSKILKIENNMFVKVPINPSYIKKLKDRIYYSPNSKNNNEYKPSKLYGKIEWDLCKDCKYKKNE